MMRRLLLLSALWMGLSGHAAEPEITLFVPAACQPCAIMLLAADSVVLSDMNCGGLTVLCPTYPEPACSGAGLGWAF